MSGKTGKENTNKLTVTGPTRLCGPLHVQKTGGIGSGVVFDLPVCFNDTVKGPFINVINVQDESTDLTNTPHSKLNFIGATVVDGGDSTADITIMGTGGSGSSNCIQQDDTRMCVIDDGGEGGGEETGGDRVIIDIDGDEYFRLNNTGGLRHGFVPEDPPNVGINSFVSGGPLPDEPGSPEAPRAFGTCCQAFGSETRSNGDGCYVEGIFNSTDSDCIGCFVTGIECQADESIAAHAEGRETTVIGDFGHAEGFQTIATRFSHAEGRETTASGDSSHAEGLQTIADGFSSHSEGFGTRVNGGYAHAEGQRCIANGLYSSASGNSSLSTAFGQWVHANGIFIGPGAINGAGDAQTSLYIFKQYISAGAGGFLRLDPNNIIDLVVPEGSSWIYCGTIIARGYNGNEVDGDDVAAWEVNGVIDRAAATDAFSGVSNRANNVTVLYDATGGNISPSIGILSNGVFQILINNTTGAAWHVNACIKTCEVKTNSARTNGGS